MVAAATGASYIWNGNTLMKIARAHRQITTIRDGITLEISGLVHRFAAELFIYSAEEVAAHGFRWGLAHGHALTSFEFAVVSWAPLILFVAGTALVVPWGWFGIEFPT
jgi:hypothetical protein